MSIYTKHDDKKDIQGEMFSRFIEGDGEVTAADLCNPHGYVYLLRTEHGYKIGKSVAIHRAGLLHFARPPHSQFMSWQSCEPSGDGRFTELLGVRTGSSSATLAQQTLCATKSN
jgi:hypothetical protein